jgi:hypothetical protein
LRNRCPHLEGDPRSNAPLPSGVGLDQAVPSDPGLDLALADQVLEYLHQGVGIDLARIEAGPLDERAERDLVVDLEQAGGRGR